MLKRYICLLLMLVVLLGALPLTAMALEDETSAEVTRAQWIQALVETFDMTVEEDNYPDNYYSDITAEDTYYRDILVAVEFGVIDLEAGLPFRPNDAATREFAAQTLNFCLGYQLDEGAEYTFSESADVSCPDDIQIAINRGWFALADGAFLPEQAVTEAEKTAMLADAAEVLAGDVVDENYANSFVFTDEVIVVPEGTAGQPVSADKLMLVSPDVTIAKGDIFAVYFDGLPTVYRAEDVTVSGTQHTIQVTKLDLYDYLISADAEGTMTGDLAKFQVAEGMEAIYVLEDGTEVASAKAAGTQKIKSIYFYREIGDVKVAIDLTDMKLTWKAKGNIFDKTSINVSAVVTGKTFCTVSVPFGASVSDFSNVLSLGTYPIGTLGSVSVTANVSIDGSITVSYGANFKAGVSYSYYEGFRLPHSFQKTHFSLTVEATLDLSVTARASLYDIPFLSAQCSITTGIKTNFVARYRGQDKTPQLCIHTDSWVYATASASASIGIDAPKIPGADEFKKEWSYSVDIWNRNTSPVRSISHFEDGTYVTSCSYGETDFFGYKNYYYSGSGSRYANGGVSALANVPTYTYTTDDDGNATITGYSGGVASISIPATIDGYKVTAIGNDVFRDHSELVAVTLPSGVTSIGSGCFAFCTSLSQVSLPDTLTIIDQYAFESCSSLIRIVIPSSVNRIGVAAFANCTSLQSINLPEGITELTAHTFYNCDALTSILIPSTLEQTHDAYIYFYAYGYVLGPFYGCDNLTNVTFAEGTTQVANGLFANCPGLTSIAVPEGVTVIEGNAFQNCANLREVKLAASLTSIEGGAFGECVSLTGITIPNAVTSIGSGAFANCTSMTTATLPKSLATMGAHAFYNCDALTAIEIPKSLEGTYDAYIYDYASGYVLGPFYDCDNLSEIIFEEGTTLVANGLFANCPGIKSITMPDTVTVVEGNAFQNCKNLEEVKLSTSLTSIEGGAFGECVSLLSIEIPNAVTSLASGTFANCTSLQTVTLSKNLSTMGAHAFYNCDALTTIVIPKSLKDTYDAYIYDYAYGYVLGPFYGCDGLTDVTFEAGSTTIAKGLFANCPGIKSITIPDTITTIGYQAFYCATGLTEIVIPDTVTTVDNQVFQGCTALVKANWTAGHTAIPVNTFNGCTALAEVELPNNLVVIGENAFRNCDALTKVKLPNSITTIYNAAFYDCNALSEIQLSASLTRLPWECFYNCDALTSVAVPDAVTYIDGHCFYDCDALETVTMGDAVTSMGGSVFQHCDVLKNVDLSRNLTSIPDSSFQQCAELAEIVVPYYVTTIGNNAFNSSPKLVKVTLPRALTSIGSNAFSYADTTVIYGVSGTYAETWAAENGFQFVASEVAATEISLSNTELTLNKGASETLILSVTPENFTDVITWKSSDTDVVTVSDKGVLSAKATGTATIKVTVGNVSASCKVTVVQPATSINLNKGSLTLQGGDTFTLTATVNPSDAANKTIAWSSSDPSVATVDENGLVTAVSKGSATITVAAQDGSGITRTCSVTVSNNLYVTDEVSQLESTHPYETNCTDAWEYVRLGAANLAVTFDSQTMIEDGFDYLYIYDGQGNQVGKYTGAELAGTTVTVPGDIVKIQLASDDSGTEWGFKVSQIEAVGDDAVGCAHSSTETRNAKDATCTAAGYTGDQVCTACGVTVKQGSEIAMKAHTEITDPAAAATCTAAGKTEGKHCSVCGTVLVAQETIPATGHSYENGKCNVCGAADPNASTPDVAGKTNPFTDVKETDFFFDPVLWAVEKGITNGYGSDTIFAPNVDCTRGQVVTFLWRAFGSPEPTITENPFVDVKEADYFYKPVLWALEKGITTGLTSTEFGSDAICTRGQVATFLWRAAGKPQPTSNDNPFQDVAETDYFYTAVLWAVEKGVTNGYGNAYTFAPAGNCNRGQIVTFLYRALN